MFEMTLDTVFMARKEDKIQEESTDRFLLSEVIEDSGDGFVRW